MDLLNKLDMVEIRVTDRFPAEDMQFCRMEEARYQESYAIYSEVVFVLKDAVSRLGATAENTYAQRLDDHEDKLYDCNERFIHKICGYFRKKYSVAIENPEWMTGYEEWGRTHKKERYDMVPLQYILDSIFDQMGGLSFEEKAFAELKEGALQALVTYSGKSKYRIQGDRLIIDEFYWSHKDRIWERYMASVDSKHHSFFKALTHFEYDDYFIHQKYGFLSDYRIDEKDGVYDKHLLSSTVISSIKVFKNGKVEVEFKNYSTAVRFMNTYFPGIAQKAA